MPSLEGDVAIQLRSKLYPKTKKWIQQPAFKYKNTDIRESRTNIALLHVWLLCGICLHFKYQHKMSTSPVVLTIERSQWEVSQRAPTESGPEFTPTYLDTELELTPTEVVPEILPNQPRAAASFANDLDNVCDIASHTGAARSRSRTRSPVPPQLFIADADDSALVAQDDELLERYTLNDIEEPCVRDNKSGGWEHLWTEGGDPDARPASTASDQSPQEQLAQQRAHLALCNFHAATSINMARGARLCQLSGLSTSTWQGAAAFSSSAFGLQSEAFASMLNSVESDLRQAAMSLCSEARSAGISLRRALPGETAVKSAANLIRSKLVLRSMQFYIGITENPCRRFEEHQKKGCYNSMDLFIFNNSSESGNAEVALLRLVRNQKIGCCNNLSDGGETRSTSQPHFMYIAWKS